MVIEACKQNRVLLDNMQKILPNYCTQVDIDNMDGNDIIQLIIELTKITAPIIAGYLLGIRDSDKLTIKFKGQIDREITISINNKSLKKMELAKKLLETANYYEELEKNHDD